MILQPPEKWLPQSLVLKGAYMHNHLADDDTPAFFGQCDDTCTRPPITVKTHTEVGLQDLTYRENASDGNHKQNTSWLLLDQATRHLLTFPAHTTYCSRPFFMYHGWLLSSIVSKTKDQLTDSQIYGPIQFNCTRVHELDHSGTCISKQICSFVIMSHEQVTFKFKYNSVAWTWHPINKFDLTRVCKLDV